MKRFGVSPLALLALTACGPELVYEGHEELAEPWTYADSVAFEYEIADTSRAYDLRLTLDHTDAYATQNLYARFVTVYPDGRRQSEPVSLELADQFGRWLGGCRGEACALEVPLQDSARFPEPGRYGLIVHQYMRTERLTGVEGVGLRIFARN